jgi:hypothetical protein
MVPPLTTALCSTFPGERDKIASLDGHLDSVIATGKEEGTRIVIQHDETNETRDRLMAGSRSIVIEKVIRMTGPGGLDQSRRNERHCPQQNQAKNKFLHHQLPHAGALSGGEVKWIVLHL